jgi:SAM-dependent methyltransferase
MASRAVSEFFDSYSRDFNAIYGNQNTLANRVINGLFRKSMRLRYVKSLQGCEPIQGRTVLDVGCGPGHYSIAVARKGAASVLGLDFAPGMIALARQHSAEAGVQEHCRFVTADFMTYTFGDPFDYSIVMGFMDYVADPESTIQRVLSLTRLKAFFSFPVDGGILGWQRTLRYRNRCELFLYRRDRVRELFRRTGYPAIVIEPISRDFFVTVDIEKNKRQEAGRAT